MNITALYEALDELVEQAETLREEFNESGDLKELEKRLDTLGARTYDVSRGVMRVISALAFPNE